MTAKINDRQIIHRGRVYNLIRENVTLDNGVTTDMEFIEHPGATAIIPMFSDSRVLLLKQYRHSLREYIWEIPAGTLDPKEEMIDCAKRELIEETGYSAEQWEKLGEITPVPGYSDERIHIYLASDLQPAEQNLDKDEIINVHKVKFSEAVEMIKNGDIQDAKSIAGLLLARNHSEGITFR
ncbi:MAG: NUDIX hydrolase [bacterium]|nr:NUDIX hydrolase [bacterium]